MPDVVEDVADVVEPQEGKAEPEAFDQERAMDKINKANAEARNLRTRVKELEAYEAKVRDIEEAQKSEAQKIQERADAAEQRAKAAETELVRERIARRHKIDDDDLDLLGTGTEEQIEARAERLAALKAAAVAAQVTAPPSEKPTESLRPGATPAGKDISPPDAYPSSWRTARTQTRKE